MLLSERVNATDFESSHFGVQLLQRLRWAVEDAEETDRQGLGLALEQRPAIALEGPRV